MTRLIDADRLIKVIEKAQFEGMGNIMSIINDAPTIPLPDFKEGYKQAILDGKTNYSRQLGEWITVNERLPEYSGLYLISIDDLVTVANFAGTCFTNRCGIEIEVDAWQPLPRPYKEADK